MDDAHPDIPDTIERTKQLDDKTAQELDHAAIRFKQLFLERHPLE